MINFLCGEVVHIGESIVVLKSGDMGWELLASSATLANCSVGDRVQLFTHLQVREDGMTLYGFSDAREKDMFLRLIGISGIGCKMAIAILSGCDIRQLALAILTGDTVALSSIKGVGKKTAERIVLELREKISEAEVKGGKTAMAAPDGEVLSVLVGLGLSQQEAARRIKLAAENGAKSSEEILSLCLKNKW